MIGGNAHHFLDIGEVVQRIEEVAEGYVEAAEGGKGSDKYIAEEIIFDVIT